MANNKKSPVFPHKASGKVLDWMVGKSLGQPVSVLDSRSHGGSLQIMVRRDRGIVDYAPSERGDHLLDKYGISTLRRQDGTWWGTLGDPLDEETIGYEGDSRLEAGLRALVCSLNPGTEPGTEEEILVPAILLET